MNLEQIKNGIVNGNEAETMAAVTEVLKGGEQARAIIDNAVIPAFDEVGRLFDAGEYFLSDMLQSAHVAHQILETLKPKLAAEADGVKAKVVIGTVKDDLHDIGKNIVAMILMSAGFEVLDLGRDVHPEAFVEAVEQTKPDIVGLSALLTTTMPAMQNTVAILRKSGVLGKAKIIVGGSPITEDFAKDIGADGYAADAPAALKLANDLCGLTNRKEVC